MSSDDVVRALRLFPLGSAGGPDELSPQHIADLVAGATGPGGLGQSLVGWRLRLRREHHYLWRQVDRPIKERWLDTSDHRGLYHEKACS